MIYKNTYQNGSMSHSIYDKIAFTDLFTDIYFFQPDYKDGKIINKNRFAYLIRKVCKENHFKITMKLDWDDSITVKRLI